MAGLLDVLNSDDGRMALGLLAAAGPSATPMSFGQRVSGAMQQFQAQKMAQDEFKMKQQMMQAQMADIQQQAELRRAQVENQRGLVSDVASILGTPGQQNQYGTAGGGISLGGQREQMVPQPGGLAGATIEQIAALKARPNGPNLLPEYELAKFGKTVNPGTYTQGLNGEMKYNLDPTKGLGFNTNTQSLFRLGNADVLSQLAGETTAAQEAAKAPYTLVEGYSNGTPGKTSLANVLRSQQPGLTTPGDQSGSNRIAPTVQAARDAESLRIIQDELAKETDPTNRAALQREIARRQAGIPGLQGQSSQSTSGLFQTGPSETEKAASGANAAFMRKQSEDAGAYINGLNDRVHQGAELNMRMQESLAALNQFKAGGGAETRAKLAQIAQGMPGIPDSVVSGIAGGSLAAMQEFNKLAVQQAMETLKGSMDGAGRIAQAEFKIFQSNNPNLSTDPNAIRRIFDFNTRLFQRDLAEQQYAQQQLKSGADPASIRPNWAQELSTRGFTKPNMSASGTTSAPSVGGLAEAAAAELAKRQKVRSTTGSW